MTEMGYQDTNYNLEHLDEAFLHLADKKGQIFDYDLEALAFINQQQEPEFFFLAYLSIQSGSNLLATATIKRICGDKEKSDAAAGNGPVDAIYQAINKIAKYPIKLISYQLSAKGHGNEALGQVDIVAECFDRCFHAIGLETDIVESSAMAMINVLNNI